MTVSLMPSPRQRFTTVSGAPAAGYMLYCFDAGTSTPRPAYQDPAGLVPHENPIRLDEKGEALVYFSGNYKLDLRTPYGATVSGYPVDNFQTVDSIISNNAAALAALGGAALVGFKAGGNGTVARTVQDKLRDTVSVKDFGAKGDGVTDDSAAIQAALSSGNIAVYVPPGIYLCTGLIMPPTVGFTLYGAGPASILRHKAGGTQLISWATTGIVYTEGYISNLGFDGTSGGNNIINTAGVGGITLKDLYISNLPAGYSGIVIDGAAGTVTHDHRILNLQIYVSNTAAAWAGVRFGPLAADSSISGMIMNGAFQTQYALYYDGNAFAIQVSDVHIYNLSKNIVFMNGSNNFCTFNDCNLDNSTRDLVAIFNSGSINFTGCYFQSVTSGYSGLTLNGTDAVTFVNCMWYGQPGAAAAVAEVGSSNYTAITGGNLGAAANFTKPFILLGASSYARGFRTWNPLGLRYALTGVTAAPQAQDTTVYLGPNGAQVAIAAAAYMMPEAGTVTTVSVATTVTPAAGQTFTFNVQKNGATIATGSIANGAFLAEIAVNTAILRTDVLTLQSVFSPTSGASDVRWCIRLTG